MQDLLVTWFGATGATVVRYAVALAVVIGLLLLLRWVLRNYASGGQLSIGRGRHSRLTVVEQVAVDQRRRLVLVRRDGVEHLILVGGGNDLVVEPTIIRGVPVGSLGRAARPAPSAPVATGEPEQVAVETPAVATPPFVQAAEPPPVVARPAPLPRSTSSAEPVRPAFPSHVASEHPKATSIQARLSRAAPRTPETARPAPASPYIPPEAHRVEPTVSPISPIVSDKTTSERPAVHEAAPVEHAAVAPTPATDDASGFDDLARQLDEALKSEIEEMKIEPTSAPAAPPAPVQPAAPAEPAAKQPRATQAAASAWLRPRAAQPARPVAQREPAPQHDSPAAPAREPAAPREPAAQPLQQRSAIRPPMAEPRAVVEPPVEAAAAPEPVAPPRPAPEATEDDGRNGSDFSSLENEMARLLDELAGDSKGKR